MRPTDPVYYLRHLGQLAVVPVVHDRVGCAQATLLACEDFRPDTVAVELPPSIQDEVCKGLASRQLTSMAVTRRLSFNLSRIPAHQMSNWRNTPRFNDAAQRLIDYGWRYAGDSGGPPVPWNSVEKIGQVSRGFDPVVILFRAFAPGDFPRDKIAVPDRTHLHNYGVHGGKFRVDTLRLCREVPDSASRTFFAPPVDSKFWPHRCTWLRRDDGPVAPTAVDWKALGDSVPDELAVLARAFHVARTRVICFCPDDMEIPDRVLVENPEVELVRISLEEAMSDPRRADDFDVIGRDECEQGDRQPETDLVEIYNLNSGDAIMEAVRWALEQDRRVAFIDRDLETQAELQVCCKRSAMDHVDDSTILDEGIEPFYLRIRKTAEKTRDPDLDDTRDRFMSRHLRKLLADGNKVLFVCGAAHWGPIKRMLSTSAPDDAIEASTPRRETPSCFGDMGLQSGVEIVCSARWSIRTLHADLNFVVKQFHKARIRGELRSFHSTGALELLRARVARQLSKQGLSPRDAISFERLLQRWCIQSKLVTPTYWHIMRVAAACLEPKALPVIRALANRPWLGCPDGGERISGVTSNGQLTATIGGDQVILINRTGPLEVTFGGQSDFGSGVFDGGRRGRRGGKGLRVAPSVWCDSMEKLAIKARAMAGVRERVERAVETTGRIGGHPAVREIIRSLSQGRRRLYHLESIPERFSSAHPFERFDPIVWDLGIDPDRHTLEKFWMDEQRDLIVSVGYTEHNARQRCFGALVNFIPLLHHDATQRVKRWISQRNRRYIPDPNSIEEVVRPERGGSDGHLEYLLYLALHFSRDHVVYVSPVPPSDSVRRRAQAQRRRLFHIPLSRFDASEIDAIRATDFVDYDEDIQSALRSE